MHRTPEEETEKREKSKRTLLVKEHGEPMRGKQAGPEPSTKGPTYILSRNRNLGSEFLFFNSSFS
jgi:hypothetical protein